MWTAIREGAQQLSRPLSLLDVGSGVTFFPFFVASVLPGTTVVATDMNPKYPSIFSNISSHRIGRAPVFFHLHDTRNPRTSLPNSTFDIITCISVLEHTDNYHSIAANLHRQLRPGGLLVVTFDIATGPGFEVPPAKAAALLSTLTSWFEELNVAGPQDYSSQYIQARATGKQGQVLDSAFMKKNNPELRSAPDWLLTISCHVFKKA